MGLTQSPCADDRWLRTVNELEIAIELTILDKVTWRLVGYTEVGPQRAWSPQSRLRARKLLTIEDGVVNVGPELPEHNGHSIERGI